MTSDDNFSSIISAQADRQFRELLTREVVEQASAGLWQAPLWTQLEESALSLALVPESHGGVGLAAGDALELVRLTGFRGLPLPLGDTLIAKALWTAAGGELERFGEAPALLACAEDGEPLRLQEADGLHTLQGRTAALGFADAPSSLLLQACNSRGDQHLVLLPSAGLARLGRTGPAFEAQAAFQLDGVELPSEAMRPWPGAPVQALQAHGALLRSLQMVGAMQRCLELGLQYAGERAQFGRHIGKFPAVQDMLVEAAAEVASAVSAAGLALERWQPTPDDDALLRVAMAKTRCGEAAGKVAALTHQVHGAIGFTQEHVLHQYTRRLWTWRDEFGNEQAWSRHIGERACALGGQGVWPLIARF